MHICLGHTQHIILAACVNRLAASRPPLPCVQVPAPLSNASQRSGGSGSASSSSKLLKDVQVREQGQGEGEQGEGGGEESSSGSVSGSTELLKDVQVREQGQEVERGWRKGGSGEGPSQQGACSYWGGGEGGGARKERHRETGGTSGHAEAGVVAPGKPLQVHPEDGTRAGWGLLSGCDRPNPWTLPVLPSCLLFIRP